MKFSDYTSLFELFTAFNFASVISDDFNLVIHKKVVYPFYKVEGEFKNIDSKIGVIKKTILALKPITGEINDSAGGSNGVGQTKKIDNSDQLSGLKNQLKQYQKELRELKKNTAEQIKLAGISLSSFPVISLFYGLFSISILYFSKFIDNRLSDSSFIDVMYIANILCFAYTIFGLYKDRKGWNFKYFNLSHLGSILVFSLIIILSFCLYQIDWSFINISYEDKPNWHIKILITLSIINAIFHFILVFWFALINTRSGVNDILKNLKDFEEKLEQFNNKEVDSMISLHDNLKKMIITETEFQENLVTVSSSNQDGV